LGELLSIPLTYHEFKQALLRAQNYVSDLFLVRGLVNGTLSYLLRRGDMTAFQEYSDNYKLSIEMFKERLVTLPEEMDLPELIKSIQGKLETLEDDLKSNYIDYSEFCSDVLVPLFMEDLNYFE